MPTFWSKLGIRSRNHGMQDDVGKVSMAKKKKKSKKSSFMNISLLDENLYENETSGEYAQDSSRLCAETIEYEDIAGILMEPKADMTDYQNRGQKNASIAGGMAHYMPKATQHLFLSSLLEGRKIDDYFQDCRLDSALHNFACFDSYETPVITSESNSQLGKENVYETIDPDSPPSPQPTVTDTKRNATRKPPDKLDILNWPTDPILTSSPAAVPKHRKVRKAAAMNSSADSAGEDLDEEDNYVDLNEHSLNSLNHARSLGHDNSFDSSAWCSGVDVLY